MKLGSLFDGIGGWLVAAAKFGITPVWSSEIEKFPIAVTKHHFPNVKQLGDIKGIHGDEIEPVDILCAGSPCQNLSVAGKREGLKGSESSLFHEAIRILREMRCKFGKPRYFVWENVPGAFSSNKGLDFRAVLEEIAETEIPMPENGKWAESGLVECDKCQIAWRILDAQYWGVPQRRKRIFLVADFGGNRAGEILFECQSLSGHTETGENKGEGTPGGTEDCVGTASGNRLTPQPMAHNSAIYDVRFTSDGTKNARGHCYETNISRCLDTAEPNPDSNHGGIAVYDMTHADEVMRKVGGGKCQTLNARMGTGGNQVPVVQVYESHPQDARIKGPLSLSPSVTQKWHKGAADTPLVCVSEESTPAGAKHESGKLVYSLQGNMIGRDDKNGPQGSGINKDISFTLNATDRHGVCTASSFAKYDEVEKAGTLKASGGDLGGGSENLTIQNSVRRLTPTECERLQGLPDGYTEVYVNGKLPDSARYKALGNGMAQPCADYVIRRIAEVSRT